MMKKISCPVNSPKSCKFIEIDVMKRGEENESVMLIKKTFPHMNINNWWKLKLKNGDSVTLKENGKNIIGIANSSYIKQASLDLLAISKEYQGRGMGTILLKEMEMLAIDKNKKIIHLMTEQIKPENIIFYSKNGYKIFGYNKYAYNHSPGVYFMKNLPEIRD